MLYSVYLNNDFLFCYVKIDDIIFNIMLSSYVVWKSFQKIIPQMFFFRRHMFSQKSCVRNEFFIVRDHVLLLIHHFVVPLLPQEKA